MRFIPLIIAHYSNMIGTLVESRKWTSWSLARWLGTAVSLSQIIRRSWFRGTTPPFLRDISTPPFRVRGGGGRFGNAASCRWPCCWDLTSRGNFGWPRAVTRCDVSRRRSKLRGARRYLTLPPPFREALRLSRLDAFRAGVAPILYIRDDS